jgi:hypothetical protein
LKIVVLVNKRIQAAVEDIANQAVGPQNKQNKATRAGFVPVSHSSVRHHDQFFVILKPNIYMDARTFSFTFRGVKSKS